MKARDVSGIEPLTGDALAAFQTRTARAEARDENGAGVNTLLAITEALPADLAKGYAEREALIQKLGALNGTIARMETHLAVEKAAAIAEIPNA